ncbi:AraC family transcriptional regulator [Dyadobacter sp. CY323]|uniref:AraC family transcriptional regulator n=1 Tax=Dyadobacter sp. CY323 TaxID=2907302 RepID=UPI001F2EFF43|nr:AraC family transcriptional regulator [Dyadobacter sp. CY323]MCE6988025.1 AraC family transcriptional regulator [Dyadobacter sp. CY323]
MSLILYTAAPYTESTSRLGFSGFLGTECGFSCLFPQPNWLYVPVRAFQSMIFEFTANPGFNFLARFSEQFDIPLQDNKLIIPERMGTGSIRKIDFSDNFKLILHHYTFNEEFVLRRNAPDAFSDLVTIVFYSSALPNNNLSNRERSFSCTKVNTSSIEVSSNDLNSEIRFPAGREIIFTVIGIKAPVLAELLDLAAPNPLIERMTNGHNTFLYHVLIDPDFEKTLKSIADTNVTDTLNKFFYKVKVQELLYLLFVKLTERETKKESRINSADVVKLMTVRDIMLTDLSVTPNLREMSRVAHMSETKMKVLFRQVFGDSIYNYYQTARMEEAASMLKQSGMAVSEVGYRLGFSNLSHFSRLFAKHHGHTPKKFQSVG